jgi:hypothetical protein
MLPQRDERKLTKARILTDSTCGSLVTFRSFAVIIITDGLTYVTSHPIVIENIAAVNLATVR